MPLITLALMRQAASLIAWTICGARKRDIEIAVTSAPASMAACAKPDPAAATTATLAPDAIKPFTKGSALRPYRPTLGPEKLLTITTLKLLGIRTQPLSGPMAEKISSKMQVIQIFSLARGKD